MRIFNSPYVESFLILDKIILNLICMHNKFLLPLRNQNL